MIYLYLLIAVIFLISRLYRLVEAKKKAKLIGGFRFNLPVRFYLEQLLYLSVLVYVLFALDPVPAFIAIAATIGVFVDTLFTAYYYALKINSKT